MTKVNMSGFADAIMEELDAYGKLAEDQTRKIVDDIAKDAVKNLRANSPKGHTRKKGTYAKGWTSKITRDRVGTYSRTLYNKQASLTHLLEFGHALRRGGRTIGSAAAYPHIAAAEQKAAESFAKKIEEALGG